MAKLIPTEGYITRYLESKKPRYKDVSAGCSLYHLRDTELGSDVAVILAPFINAYRPHDKKPERDELKEAGYELIRRDSFTDELKEVYWELRGYYPEDNPELHPDEEADG